MTLPNRRLRSQPLAVIRWLLIVLAYWATVRLGLFLVAQPEGVASLWPASGLAVAFFILSPRRQWPGLLAVIFVTNVLGNFMGGNSLPVSLGFALVNSLEAVLCAGSLLFLCRSKSITFEQTREVLALFVTVIVVSGLTAVMGAAIPALASGAPFFKTWQVWWVADGLGICLVTPLLITWVTSTNTQRFTAPRQMIEGVLLIFVLTLFAWLLFGPFTVAEKPFLRNYMVFPLLVWLAFRFSPRGMTSGLLLLAVIAVVNTLEGYGVFSFADQTSTERLVSVQIFLGVATFSGLLASAVVTEYKKNAQALKTAEANYRSIFEHAPVGFFQSLPSGRFLNVNPKMAQIFGFESSGEMLADVADISHQIHADPESRADFVRQITEQGQVIEFVRKNLRRDGSSIWTMTNARLVKDAEDKILYYEGFLRDVTENKKIEAALRSSEEKYRTVADFTYDWEAWRASEGVYLYVSPSCERISGYPPAEFLADPQLMLKITHPEDRSSLLAHYDLITGQDRDQTHDLDFRILTRQGETRWIGHLCVPVYSKSGQFEGRRESNRDITERKQSEQILLTRLALREYGFSHSLAELLQKALDEAELLTGSQAGFFHYLEADEKTISLQAWSTNTLQKVCRAEGDGLHYDLDHGGGWVDCVRQRRVVIHNDYASLPHRKGLPEGHASIVRELVVPIFRQERIVAVLGVGNKARDYNEKDVQAVSLLADLVWDLAERKRVDESLRESEERYRRLTEAITDYIYTTRIEVGQVAETIHSPSCVAVTGYTSQEFAEDPYLWYRMVWPEDRELVQDQIGRLMSGLEAPVIEHRITRKNGALRWIQNTLSPHFNEQQELTSYDGLIQDITARKQMEAALRESEEHYRRLFENMLNGFSYCKMLFEGERPLDFIYLDVNSAFETLTGLKNVVGHKVSELLPGILEADPELFERYGRVALSGQPETFEIYSSSLKMWFSSSVYSPAREYFVVIFAVITERKQAEAALRSSEENLRKAQQFAHLGSWIWDIATNQLEWSDEMYNIFDVDRETFSGSLAKVIAQSIHPDDRAKVEASNSSAIHQGRPIPLDYRILRRDGSVRVVWGEAGELVRDEAGRPIRLSGTVQDITERKQLEEDLRASLAEKEVLLKEVHHRVKNNLQIVSSLLSMQAASSDNELVTKALDESKNRVRAMALIHEKLYQSKNLEYIQTEEYISDLIDHLSSSFATQMKNVAFDLQIASLTFDINRAIPCGMIITELVSNVLKYAFPGGRPGIIQVHLSATEGRLRLMVSDNGVGLPTGVDFQHPETLGLELVSILSHQLKAELEVIRQPGATFILTFKN